MTKEEKHKNKLVQNYKEGTSKGADGTEEAAIEACKSVAMGLTAQRDK